MEKTPNDLIISYHAYSGTDRNTQYAEVLEALNNDYRIVDVFTNTFNCGSGTSLGPVVVTVVLTLDKENLVYRRQR